MVVDGWEIIWGFRRDKRASERREWNGKRQKKERKKIKGVGSDGSGTAKELAQPNVGFY